MRIAVLADIHGNVDALDGVLRDLSRGGSVDHILVLGDLVAFGSDVIPVVERLDSMAGASCIRGNTDRWVASGESPLPPEDRRTEEHPEDLSGSHAPADGRLRSSPLVAASTGCPSCLLRSG